MRQYHLTECPRDAMQGIEQFIPTEEKIQYISQLLKVGFQVLDMGSFVSPKYIPQMADTEEVLDAVNGVDTLSKKLCIVANERGVERAVSAVGVDIVGYPFSISETFQKRNTRAGINESWGRLAEINQLASGAGLDLVVYLSMGFGNPYGDEWSSKMVVDWVDKLMEAYQPRMISLADTTGSATVEQISDVFTRVRQEVPGARLGIHLHSKPEQAEAKVEAALNSGCSRFEGAINGIGGCPMASDQLTGNIATQAIISVLSKQDSDLSLDSNAYQRSIELANELFLKYH